MDANFRALRQMEKFDFGTCALQANIAPLKPIETITLGIAARRPSPSPLGSAPASMEWILLGEALQFSYRIELR